MDVTVNERTTDARRESGPLARAILSLHPGILTAAFVAFNFASLLCAPGSMASILLGIVLVLVLGGWWWALVTVVMQVHPTPGRRWPWLLILPLALAPFQWLAERWLGPMDGELSGPQVLFQFATMPVAIAFLYGLWRMAAAFEQAERGEKAKAEQVLATVFLLVLLPIGAWVLRTRIRRLLASAA